MYGFRRIVPFSLYSGNIVGPGGPALWVIRTNEVTTRFHGVYGFNSFHKMFIIMTADRPVTCKRRYMGLVERKYVFMIPDQAITHRTYGSSNSNWYVKFQMFMLARAFWRVSYFAVFYKEYLNFSWYYLIEAYIFSISI